MKGKYIFYFFIVMAALLVVSNLRLKGFVKPKVAGVNTESNAKEVRGLVVSHHELAREYILRTIERLSKDNKYTNIVIIGPNHFYPDETAFLTSSKVLEYPISSDIVQSLITQQENLIEDEAKVEGEHSFNVPAKYLSDYYPNAKLIPLLIPQNFDKRKISNLAQLLAKDLPDDTLFVASVDFSHETNLLESENKDRESELAIKNLELDKIYDFKSDHMDSPPSIGLLINIMEDLGTTNWELWFDTHGALIENDPTIQGTSYLFGVFSD